jgi:hypothetical protein
MTLSYDAKTQCPRAYARGEGPALFPDLDRSQFNADRVETAGSGALRRWESA